MLEVAAEVYVRVLSLCLLIACGGSNRAATSPSSGVPDPEVPTHREEGTTPGSQAAIPGEAPTASQATPDAAAPHAAAALYASCEERLEGPEADGECSSDADCMATGCSSEVCTTKASAGDLMTTCEVLPCFSAVDSCGCVEGRCRWSLAEAVAAPKTIPLPPQ